MNARKMIGVILIIIGVAAAVWGYNEYDAASAQLSRAVTGDTPKEAWIGMIGGAIAVVLGIFNIK